MKEERTKEADGVVRPDVLESEYGRFGSSSEFCPYEYPETEVDDG